MISLQNYHLWNRRRSPHCPLICPLWGYQVMWLHKRLLTPFKGSGVFGEYSFRCPLLCRPKSVTQNLAPQSLSLLGEAQFISAVPCEDFSHVSFNQTILDLLPGILVLTPLGVVFIGPRVLSLPSCFRLMLLRTPG